MKRIGRSFDKGRAKKKRFAQTPQAQVNEDETDPPHVIFKELISQKVDNSLRQYLGESGSKNLQNTERLISDFDPDSRDVNVKSWVNKIEQLGKIYNWSDEVKSFNLQAKLQGQARVWYNRLDSYEHSWEEWKAMLIKAFPRHHDYASLIEELMARKKLTSETMTKYYQEKLAMCFRCQLSDQASVSCIIKGLPYELQTSAQAYQSATPEHLYEGFLSAIDHYQVNHSVRSSSHIVRAPNVSRAETVGSSNKESTARKIPICYRCNENGHVAPNCTLPDKRKCYRCGKEGHIANNCTTTRSGAFEAAKKVQILSNLNDAYRKTVRVNEVLMKAYVDTGSELNVMAFSAAQAMGLQIKPTNTKLKGFAGCAIDAKGEVTFDLQVDEVQMRTSAAVTDADLGCVVLIIGQPVINHEEVTLNVSRSGVQLSMVTADNINCVDVIEEAICFRVQVDEDVEIPPGTSLVKVLVNGGPQQNVCTKPRQFSMGNISYAIASTLLSGTGGYVKVCNVGDGTIRWKKGETITRAETCETCGEVSVFLLSRGENKEECVLQSVGGVNLDDIDVGSDDAAVRTSLMELLSSYSDCFANSTKEIGVTTLGELQINLTTDKPICRRPYRLAQSERDIVQKKVEDLLDGNIIRESESPYASPIILVKKKCGDLRMCVDYRALNSVTIKERFPLPHIDDQLSKLAGKKVFTSLDLYSGYHHLRVSADSVSKTAFVTPDGVYEYLRVPFGLANAPSAFMRVIQKLVKMVSSDELVAFMDDMLISTVDIDSNLRVLEKLLVQLRAADLKLNMRKCSFLKDQVTFLGHEIGTDGIRPSNHKIEAVSNFKTPSNLHELRQFLGLCSYFRKFIEKFAYIAKPLTDLTKKSSEWSWNGSQKESFELLKEKLCSKPVLALYDQSAETEIHTDASKIGIGGILLQWQKNGVLKPVFYFSRVTSREESMYHSYELETLAVVESLKRFRVYVLGKKVKVVTDCTAVRYTLQKKDVIPRIARWWFTIQEYDIDVEYRPGERMKHVDALSRNPVTSRSTRDSEVSERNCIPNSTDSDSCLFNINPISADDWFLTVQMQDNKLSNIIIQLREGNACSDVQNNYVIKNDRLYKKTLNGERLVVPAFARWKLMQKFHDQIGHVGLKRCEEIIKTDYWFPKMTRFITKYVRSCLECAYGKGNYGKLSGELHPIPKSSIPMETLHIDHLGPFSRTTKGYQYILMIIDGFSKFLIARPTRTISSVETVAILKDVFSLFGYPKRLISDRNLAFTSRVFKQFATHCQMHHTLNAIACPRANGQVERYNRTLLDAMRTRNIDPNMWTECLPDVLWGMNNTYNESLGYHPYEIMFGHKGRLLPNLSVDNDSVPVEQKRQIASQRLEQRANMMKQRYDKQHKPEKKFSKGDLVLWKQAPTGQEVKNVNHKLQLKYSGPYLVHKVLGNDRYEIRSVKGMRGYKKFSGVVAADALRPYHSAPQYSETSSDEDIVTRDDLIDLLES